MLMCFTMGGGLKRFFRTCYHVFRQVTIHVTAHVTIHLWYFCTVPNASLSLAHYYMGYCIPDYTFQWNKCIFASLSTCHHALLSIFLKMKCINNFTRGNASQNWQLCTYFTGNVLEDIEQISMVEICMKVF